MGDDPIVPEDDPLGFRLAVEFQATQMTANRRDLSLELLAATDMSPAADTTVTQ